MTDSHLAIPDFSLFRRDRPERSHGGLLVYVRNNFRVTRHPELENVNIECISLEVSPTHILFFCYRPANQNPTLFF